MINVNNQNVSLCAGSATLTRKQKKKQKKERQIYNLMSPEN